MNWFHPANPYRHAPVMGATLSLGILIGIPPLIIGGIILITSLYLLHRDGVFDENYFQNAA